MRHLPILFILLLSEFVFAQTYSNTSLVPSNQTTDSNEILIPVKKTTPDGKTVEFFATLEAPGGPLPDGPTLNRENNYSHTGEPSTKGLSALDIIRIAMNHEQTLEHQRNEKMGWFKSANLRLVPESATFFIATGLVIAETAWTKAYADPMAMERHILSLTDPIATASFYAFMQVNGYHMYRKGKTLSPTMDAHTRAQMVRSFSYGGLVRGSLASALISDIFSPFKECLTNMFDKDYRFTEYRTKKCQTDLNAAYANWTVRNKFAQYAPQVMSLVLSQKISEVATEVIPKGTGAATNFARKTFSKVSWLSWIEKMISSVEQNAWLKKQALKITGADVLITIVPGKAPIVALTWLGKLVHFTGFMAIDHMISPLVYRGFNNLWLPTAFKLDVLNLNHSMNLAERFQWKENESTKKSLECPVQAPNCLDYSNLSKEITNFSVQAQKWREHINAQNEQDLAGWMEMTKKILSQIGHSYNFYSAYIEKLQETLFIGSKVSSGKMSKEAVATYSTYPYRQLPLYGVLQKTENENPVSINDQYYLTPQHMEKYQIAHIRETTGLLQAHPDLNKVSQGFSKKGHDVFYKILYTLNSNDAYEIAKGLVLMNTITGIYGAEKQQASGFRDDMKLIKLLKDLRVHLGNPLPILHTGAGFAQAFSYSDASIEMGREANFSLSNNTYIFNRDADYMIYQMICGPQKGTLTDNTFFTDNFLPPSLIKPNNKPVQICNTSGSFTSSDQFYSNELKNSVTGKNYAGPIEYITQHLDYSLIGDYTKNSQSKNFENWWLSEVKEKTRPRFQDFDKKYAQLVAKTYDTLFGENLSDEKYSERFKSELNYKLDQLNLGDYLPKSILGSLKFELEFYLTTLQSILNKNVLPLNKGEKDFMNLIKKESLVENSSGIYGSRHPELAELNALFASYFATLRKKEITFKDYSQISKKISEKIDLVKKLTNASETKNSSDLFSRGSSLKETSAQKIEQQAMAEQISKVQKDSATAAIEGIKQVESEVRRFLRMKLLLSQTLDINAQEFLEDIKNDTKDSSKNHGQKSAHVRGGG